MNYNEAVTNIYQSVEQLQEETKKRKRADIITSSLPISTLDKFNQVNTKEGIHITVITVHKVAKRIDALNRKQKTPTTYAKEFEKLIKYFIKHFILVDKKLKLTHKYQMNFETLSRMSDFNIRKSSISVNTLLYYAYAIEHDQPLKKRSGD